MDGRPLRIFFNRFRPLAKPPGGSRTSAACGLPVNEANRKTRRAAIRGGEASRQPTEIALIQAASEDVCAPRAEFGEFG
jgi:hypothetical protein